MGTVRTHYVMLGAKLPFDIIDREEDYEKFDAYEDNGYRPEIKEHNGLTMVTDGMNGEYVFIGKVLKKALDHEGLEVTDCLAFSQREMNVLENLIRSEFWEEFGEEFKDRDIGLSVWAFTHWH